MEKALLDYIEEPWILTAIQSAPGEENALFFSLQKIRIIILFHRDSPYYNEHRTAERIQGEQYLNGTQITFIVDFLLPYIGWTMEYIEFYSLEESCLESLIEEFLQDDERLLMSDEVEAFSFYRKKHVRVSDI